MLDEEQKKKITKQQAFHIMAKEDYEKKIQKKQIEALEIQKQRDEYNQLLKNNEERQLLKEANYRNVMLITLLYT